LVTPSPRCKAGGRRGGADVPGDEQGGARGVPRGDATRNSQRSGAAARTARGPDLVLVRAGRRGPLRDRRRVAEGEAPRCRETREPLRPERDTALQRRERR